MSEADPCVAQVPIFQGLSPEEQLEVARFAKPQAARKGQVLSTAGTRISRLLVVHSGRLKVSHVGIEGQEQVLRTVSPGEVVGEHAFLTGEPANNLVVALEDTRVCTFEHRDLSPLLAQYPDIAARMLRTLSDRLASAERLLAAVTSSNVGARVAAYLLDLPARPVQGSARVTLPMAKHEVAAYLGTTPETLSRRLSALVKQGAISLHGRRDVVILDSRALEDAAAPTR